MSAVKARQKLPKKGVSPRARRMRKSVQRATRLETGLVRFVALLAILGWAVLSIFDQSAGRNGQRAIATDGSASDDSADVDTDHDDSTQE